MIDCYIYGRGSTLDRIVHDAYRVKLEALDPEQDISMREIYGLKDEY